MKHYCNPMDLEYKFEYCRRPAPDGKPVPFRVYREAADPTLILYQGTYFLFPSMTQGFFTSEDLLSWEFYPFGPEIPIYDYAPDVREVNGYLYFSASRRGENGSFYRTKDPRTEPFEKIVCDFDWWDPNLFLDDDGKLYFYWGCSNTTPIYGVELDPETMLPLTERKVLLESDAGRRGYERFGEDHVPPRTQEEIEAQVNDMLEQQKRQAEETGKPLPVPEEELRRTLEGFLSNAPFIEGAWMTKREEKYYLQYAIPGTEFNVYADGVYTSDSPLGPFVPAENNPYSYKPGGFITGAGHGSTLEDKEGNWWHIASMRISYNADFERRLGLFKAGFDEDGQLYCDQRFGDWPVAINAKPFDKPDWMLLSYQKPARVSSGEGAERITDEDIRTFWQAGTNRPGEWAELDLGEVYRVYGVQLNFQEAGIARELPEGAKARSSEFEERWLDPVKQPTRWLLEGSLDGKAYFTIEDRSHVDTDYSHPFIEREEGVSARFLKLTILEVPYQANPAVSGIRVFGLGNGAAPAKASHVTATLNGELDMNVSWQAGDAIGANVLWGYEPGKLYHSRMVLGDTKASVGALVAGQAVYVRVDAFNENGVTEGDVIKVRD